MDIIGKWKIKEFNIPTPDGIKKYTPETLPDTEEFEEFAKMLSTRVEFTEDGLLNTLMQVPEEMLEAAKEQGFTVREDGFAVIDSTAWKEEDGKFFFDSKIEGEILGEEVDPFTEIKVTEDGCLLYSFDILLLEKE